MEIQAPMPKYTNEDLAIMIIQMQGKQDSTLNMLGEMKASHISLDNRTRRLEDTVLQADPVQTRKDVDTLQEHETKTTTTIRVLKWVGTAVISVLVWLVALIFDHWNNLFGASR